MPDRDDPGRLTGRSYWEGLHERAPGRRQEPPGGARAFLAAGGHRQYLIDELLLAPHVPPAPGWTLVEVGSAPGRRLVHFHRRFGCRVYGVDYSEAGVRANREAFIREGIDPAQVLLVDFLSPDFRRERRGAFDVVFSIGLVEHFEDAREAVAAHAELVRPGGLLVVAVPNLLGLNRCLTRLFDPEALARHNLAIMRRPAFLALFDGLGLVPLYAGYLGAFPLGLFQAPSGGWRGSLLRAGWRLEAAAELACRRLLGTRHPRARWLSPYLAFTGRKTAPSLR